jgi:hypothetical protein
MLAFGNRRRLPPGASSFVLLLFMLAVDGLRQKSLQQIKIETSQQTAPSENFRQSSEKSRQQPNLDAEGWDE